MNHSPGLLRDTLALTFASLFPLAMALIYFVALDLPEGKPNPAVLWAFGIGKTIQFGFPAAYVWWFARQEIRFTMPTLRGMATGIGFALLVCAAMMVLFFGWVRYIPAVIEHTPAKIFLRLQEFHCDTPMRYVVLGIFICCVHSLLEEYYWRWFVFGYMRRRMPVWAACALSGLGFMLHHIVVLGVDLPGHFWTLAMPFAVCVGVGGGFWAWLYHRSQSLYACWVSHCIVDGGILALGYVMLQHYWQ